MSLSHSFSLSRSSETLIITDHNDTMLENKHWMDIVDSVNLINIFHLIFVQKRRCLPKKLSCSFWKNLTKTAHTDLTFWLSKNIELNTELLNLNWEIFGKNFEDRYVDKNKWFRDLKTKKVRKKWQKMVASSASLNDLAIPSRFGVQLREILF